MTGFESSNGMERPCASYPVWTDIDVRFRDCDPMNHVNNAVYATYLEVGRQAYWARFSDPRAFLRVPFVIARLTIDYRSPARVGEGLRVYVRAAWIGRRSFGMEYEIRERRSGRLVAEASSVQTTFDPVEERVIPVPDELRRRIEDVEGRKLPDRAS